MLGRLPIWAIATIAGGIAAGITMWPAKAGAVPPGAKPPAPSGPPATPTLHPGDTDAQKQGAVSYCQGILGVPKTGIMDAATVAAVKAFQSSHHVPGGADGIVGKNTWAALLGKPTAPAQKGGGAPAPPMGSRMDSGRMWAQGLPPNATPEREAAILAAIDAQFLNAQPAVPVTYRKGPSEITIYAMPDCLMIGYSDPVRVNVNHATAQRIADRFGMMLPTSLMSDKAWEAATKLTPQTMPADAKMATTERMIGHSDKVEAAKTKSGASFVRPCGKDWVNSERLLTADGKPAVPAHSTIGGGGGPLPASANFGWQWTSGGLKSPGGVPCLQSVGLAHDINHTDYSQVCTLYGKLCTIDGQSYNIEDVLQDPERAYLLSDEVQKGTACRVWRYPPIPPGG